MSRFPRCPCNGVDAPTATACLEKWGIAVEVRPGSRKTASSAGQCSLGRPDAAIRRKHNARRPPGAPASFKTIKSNSKNVTAIFMSTASRCTSRIASAAKIASKPARPGQIPEDDPHRGSPEGGRERKPGLLREGAVRGHGRQQAGYNQGQPAAPDRCSNSAGPAPAAARLPRQAGHPALRRPASSSPTPPAAHPSTAGHPDLAHRKTAEGKGGLGQLPLRRRRPASACVAVDANRKLLAASIDAAETADDAGPDHAEQKNGRLDEQATQPRLRRGGAESGPAGRPQGRQWGQSPAGQDRRASGFPGRKERLVHRRRRLGLRYRLRRTGPRPGLQPEHQRPGPGHRGEYTSVSRTRTLTFRLMARTWSSPP